VSWTGGYSHPVLRVNSSLPGEASRLMNPRERNLTRMRHRSFFSLTATALLAVFVLAIPALAKPFTKTINISQAAKLGKATLQAGEYRLVIDGNKATVERNRQTVAESEGRWEDRDTPARYTSILLGADGQVREVRFEGQKRVFVFGE